MAEIKKLETARSFFLQDNIQIRAFQVASMSLFQSDFGRMSLVSMGEGEEISAETMPNARFFHLLVGEAHIKMENDIFSMKRQAFLSLPENSFYSIHADKNSIFLEIEYDRGGNFMSDIKTIQHITRANTFTLVDEISYEKGQITSKNLVANSTMVMTLMAFDEGESLAAHKAPGDALITILDGEGKFVIDGKENIVKAGENILLPGNIPHAVEATKAFKMLLIIAK